MACEVFKIVNNIAPSFIQNLITLKCSQYSMRKENTAVSLRQTHLNMDLNHLSMMRPGSGTA